MFKTNEYFDGNVKSIAFASEQGPATVGVMAAGEYEFGTSNKEIMTVVSGAMNIRFPDGEAWKRFEAGERFEVEANQRFGVRVEADCAYLCLYK